MIKPLATVTSNIFFICALGLTFAAHAAEDEKKPSKSEISIENADNSTPSSRTEDVPSIDSAAAEIKKLNGKIASMDAASKKEVAQTRKQIEHRYIAQRQDEFETSAQFKLRKAQIRNTELAQMEAKALKVKEEIESLRQRIHVLTESEYVLGAESIATELGRYNADTQIFPVSLRSKTPNVKLDMHGNIPLPVAEARIFKQEWSEGQVRPEVKAKLSSDKLELSLTNRANNTRYVLYGTSFITPEAALNEAAAAKLAGVMIAIPGKHYEIDKTEVTQEQWLAVMGTNPSHFKGADLPVETVSWYDIQGFITKLNQKSGKQYRLPTKAEWEFACYGGKKSGYCGGDDIDEVAWHDGNSGGKTHPVGQKKANDYGLYDMSGNVREWVQDVSHGRRILLGGSWFNPADYVRTDNPRSYEPTYRAYGSGFRLARTLP